MTIVAACLTTDIAALNLYESLLDNQKLAVAVRSEDVIWRMHTVLPGRCRKCTYWR